MSEVVSNFAILPLVQPNYDNQIIDVQKIRNICCNTLSENPPEDRAIAWMVLLKVYPPNAIDWNTTKDQIMSLYEILISEYQVENWQDRIFPPNVKKEAFGLENNPLMSVIHGDIVRTGRHIYFLPPEDIPEGCDPESIQAPFTVHMRRLERILYVFANQNPGLSYMQGFNELLVPLYFVLVQAKSMFHDDMLLIEALTYSMFQNLLTYTDLQEFYVTKDQSTTIVNKLKIFENLMKIHIPQVYKLLTNLNVFPLLYAYRWYNLLFSQEHDLPVLLMVWDSLFSHMDHIVEYSFYIGVAQVKEVSPLLDPTSFPKTVNTLQNLTIPNALSIVKEANIMWAERKEKGKK